MNFAGWDEQDRRKGQTTELEQKISNLQIEKEQLQLLFDQSVDFYKNRELEFKSLADVLSYFMQQYEE